MGMCNFLPSASRRKQSFATAPIHPHERLNSFSCPSHAFNLSLLYSNMLRHTWTKAGSLMSIHADVINLLGLLGWWTLDIQAA